MPDPASVQSQAWQAWRRWDAFRISVEAVGGLPNSVGEEALLNYASLAQSMEQLHIALTTE